MLVSNPQIHISFSAFAKINMRGYTVLFYTIVQSLAVCAIGNVAGGRRVAAFLKCAIGAAGGF